MEMGGASLLKGVLAAAPHGTQHLARSHWGAILDPHLAQVRIVSQAAAGWLKHLAGDQVDIWSAGSEPADQINPTAVQV